MKIVAAIIIFGIIVFLHELGHFTAARIFKVKVNEFSVGMGPAIFKKKKGDTLYSVRLLPLGGYCAMDGAEENSTDENSFLKKKPWQRIIILLAGAIMNLLLGFVIMVCIVSTQEKITSTTVSGFYENARSEATGLRAGDKITKINGNSIRIDSDISYNLVIDEDGVFDFEVVRDGRKTLLKDVSFDMQDNPELGRKSIILDFAVVPVDVNPLTVIGYSFEKTVYIAKSVWLSLRDVISGKYKLNDLSGPIGVVNVIGSVIDPTKAFLQNLKMVANISAFISINIGIFNILPLPALDGGRVVFRIFEWITRKSVKPEVEGTIHLVGIVLLLVLAAVVSYNDIIKLFG